MDDEEQLIRRVLARQGEAEEDFVRRYRGLVLGLARGRFGLTENDAEELLQATIEKLWSEDCRALRTWRGRGRFTSYLTVIVTHLFLRQKQNQQRRREEALAADELSAIVDGARSVADALVVGEQRRLVDEERCRMPVRDQLLLALRFTDERSAKDIAAVTGQRPGTVRKAIHDALGRLRRRLMLRRPELFERPESRGGAS